MRTSAKTDGRTVLKYAVRCDCGTPIHVEAGQAGVLVPCPSCGRPISIPSLSVLRKLPAVASPATDQRFSPRRYQFRIRDMLAITVGWAIALGMVTSDRVMPILILISALVLLVFLDFARDPRDGENRP